jgi:hypothetical protein
MIKVLKVEWREIFSPMSDEPNIKAHYIEIGNAKDSNSAVELETRHRGNLEFDNRYAWREYGYHFIDPKHKNIERRPK